MADDLTKKLAQLRQAHESGVLDDDTYRASVAALEQQSHPAVTVQGSGSIAQGEHATSAGAGGLAVSGSIIGNVYMGPPPKDTKEALDVYCRVLRAQWQHFLLRGLDKQSSDSATQEPQHLQLDHVYVNLNTTTQHERESMEGSESHPVTSLEAAWAHTHVVILGDPGSGKSTFVNYLGFCLASAWLEPAGNWHERLPGVKQNDLGEVLPISIILRDFAQWISEDMTKANPQPHHLWSFLVSRLKAQQLEFVADPLREGLDSGKIFMLLDGLDEIPTPQQRTWVRDAVGIFMSRYASCRMLVTCRILSYQDTKVQLPGIPSFQLAPFNHEQIETFIESWYVELHRAGQIQRQDQVDVLTGRLKEAVRRHDLQRLAPNPLLLTVMALVHTHKGRLPDARALLYEETMEILLWRWEQMKAQYQEQEVGLLQLLQQADRTDVDLKRVLWELAFTAHQQGSPGDDRLADIGESELIKALSLLHPNRSLDWGKAVVEAIKLRAGLLVERVPERFTFPHRTFQEYLAGAHIAAQADFSQQAAVLADESALWREVILLAVGRLVYLSGDIEKPLALVAELCPSQMSEKTDREWRKQWLAGDVLKEIGINRVKDRGLGRELLTRVQRRLVGVLQESPLLPRERAEAGNTLADIGDPRFWEDAWFLQADSLLGFIEIPSGSFQMGETGNTKTFTIPYAYYISKFPVTQAQFQAFVDDNGYQHERYWPEAKAVDLWENGMIMDRKKQKSYEAFFDLPNHPVVGVTWYEALAYCRWLTEKLRDWKDTPEPLRTLLRTGGETGKPWSITLPNEPEWEKSARGDKDDRPYPWGDNVDPNLANYSNTQINATCGVGCFAKGASPYGIEEMSGNVWEWTRSLYDEKPYPSKRDEWSQREDFMAKKDQRRVLRGGSWFNSDNLMRCADRLRYGPDDRNDLFGFRVVASPFSDL
ncbi:MAG: hypothetical protein NPIRA04_13390 [Nitrospirales bacterium]|nr:MAG: hypothetical protein NPIRA04_13390 [Nitrospirales bacterium]